MHEIDGLIFLAIAILFATVVGIWDLIQTEKFYKEFKKISDSKDAIADFQATHILTQFSDDTNKKNSRNRTSK